MESLSAPRNIPVEDLTGCSVLPTYCDSHTHIVFAHTREEEFADRLMGMTYQQIAEKGGGILNSAKKLAAASEEDLYKGAYNRIQDMLEMGTGAIEIKSGYGLSTDAELKMLRVIKQLKEQLPIPIKATFLGAHAIPEKYMQRKADYIALIKEEMLPIIATEKLADYCDVFCEKGYFSDEETRQVLKAGIEYGLKPKIHAEQMSWSGGTEVGVELQARSVDHLEFLSEKDIQLLKNSEVVATLLPGAAFFLNLKNPPTREMIDAGVKVALASDYNPGSCLTGNMALMVAIACIRFGMLPVEAFNAATVNSALAMDCEKEVGSLTIGKRANFYTSKRIDNLNKVPYHFGENLIQEVYINGIKFQKQYV